MKRLLTLTLILVFQGANASFLTDFAESFGQQIGDKLADRQNIYVESKTVSHMGVAVTYDYQVWRIKPESVCSVYQGDIAHYSRCTQAAKSLFHEYCSYLQKNPQKNRKYGRMKNMYCNAANTYKPTVANLVSSPGNTELEQAKQDCSLATVEAMNNYEAAIVKKRDRLCQKYRDMKK
jgi:hypothetical protein